MFGLHLHVMQNEIIFRDDKLDNYCYLGTNQNAGISSEFQNGYK